VTTKTSGDNRTQQTSGASIQTKIFRNLFRQQIYFWQACRLHYRETHSCYKYVSKIS